MMYSIADLHCDLLCYLAGNPGNTPEDSRVRCSIPQLRAGGVKLQVLPIYTETHPDSVEKGQSQLACFKNLIRTHSAYVVPFQGVFRKIPVDKISLMIAIENISSFIGEEEPLETGLRRLRSLFEEEGKVVYVSLTWNGENRFGGGAHSSKGLKADGKVLLHALAGQSIAVDLSHSSDLLACDILDEIHRFALNIPVIASHSNARSVKNVPRNLPDELIREIVARQGLIGLNFYRPFLGEDPIQAFSEHVEYFLRLGASDSLCFGADFFYENDLPIAYRKKNEQLFFPGYDQSSCYSKVIDLWKERLGLDEGTLLKISWMNLVNFVENKIYASSRKTPV